MTHSKGSERINLLGVCNVFTSLFTIFGQIGVNNFPPIFQFDHILSYLHNTNTVYFAENIKNVKPKKKMKLNNFKNHT